MTTKVKLIADGAILASPTFTGTVEIPNLTISSAQGTDGQVLTSTGSGIAWEDASGGVDGIVSSADATAITIGSDESVDFAKGVVVLGSGTTAGVYLNGTNSDTATQGNFVRYGTNFATQSNGDNSLLITKAFNGSTFLDAFTVKSDGNVDISNGNLTLGSTGATSSSATPVEINLGGTFADSAGSAAKAKLKIYEHSTNIYGLGVSSGTFEYFNTYGSGKHDWYIGTDRKMRITHDGIIDLKTNNTGAIVVPNGTTAQRPSSPVAGMIRYNTDDSKMEGYIDGAWEFFNLGTPSLTTISGLDLWADVTGGISNTTITDLSGNSRTGTALNTTAKGTAGTNTYLDASSNYIDYVNTKIPNYAQDVTYFFVITNMTNNSGHKTFIGQAAGSAGYQIIRSNTLNLYFQNSQGTTHTLTNTGYTVNSTLGSSSQIITFSFGASANGNFTVYKRTGGTNTSDVFGNSTFGSTVAHSWTANGGTTRIGNSNWGAGGAPYGGEELDAGIFAWGIIDHEITSSELSVIYNYYEEKGLGN